MSTEVKRTKSKKKIKVGKRYVLKPDGHAYFKGIDIDEVTDVMFESLKYCLRKKLKEDKKKTRKKITLKDLKTKEDRMFTKKELNKFDKNIQQPFFFREYQPLLFRHIRKSLGIKEADFVSSITNDMLILAGFLGKSGSLFYRTHDKKYIIKTIKKTEKVFMFSFLPYYVRYIKKKPNTFLCRFLGSYRVKLKGKKNVRFIIMNNIFYTELKIHRKFDIKGSFQGRIATEKEKEKKENCILKDRDILNTKIFLGKRKTKEFFKQIKSDTEFLATQKIMDYSILLGIHNDGEGKDVEMVKIKDEKEKEKKEVKKPVDGKGLFQSDFGGCKGGITINGKPVYYYIGVIDIMQSFNAKKRLEYFLKGFRWSRKKISCNPPTTYRKRFLKFLEGIFSE